MFDWQDSLRRKGSLGRKLESLPVEISDRIMSLRVKIAKKSLLPFGSSAPTLNSSHDIKEEFYSRLRRQLTRLPAGNKLLMGDFNVRVGNEFLSWSNVIDRHCVGKINSNGLLLLPFCTEFNLFIINTVMPSSREIPKTKRKHPI